MARNGRDWHTLLEFCTLVNSLIIDEDGVYDPKLVNDRLLLGMKGTFSELELSILRQRSQEALRLKAARGDLHTTVAVGYVRSADDRLEIDPDKRVREAVHFAFRKFAEFASVRQVAIWLCDEGIKMPIVVHGPRGRMVEWKLPRYNTIHRLLTNPIYAGAYVFGRTGFEPIQRRGGNQMGFQFILPQPQYLFVGLHIGKQPTKVCGLLGCNAAVLIQIDCLVSHDYHLPSAMLGSALKSFRAGQPGLAVSNQPFWSPAKGSPGAASATGVSRS